MERTLLAPLLLVGLGAVTATAAGGMARAAAREARGTLTLVSTTEGATVFVDGKEVGKVPIEDPIPLPAGRHTIKVTARGCTDYADTFDIRPGEDTQVEADLLPVAGFVKVRVEGKLPASVAVDDAARGPTPFEGEVPAGSHRVRVSAPGYRDHVQTLRVEALKEYDLVVRLEPLAVRGPNVAGAPGLRRGDPRAGAGAAGGTDTGVPEGAPSPPNQEQEDDRPFYRRWWFWTATAAVGVAAAAVGVGLAVSSEPEERPPDTGVCVFCAP